MHSIPHDGSAVNHIDYGDMKLVDGTVLDVYLNTEARQRIKAATPGGESRAVHRFLDLPVSYVLRLRRWLEAGRSGSLAQLYEDFDADPMASFACPAEVFVGALLCAGYEFAGGYWERPETDCPTCGEGTSRADLVLVLLEGPPWKTDSWKTMCRACLADFVDPCDPHARPVEVIPGVVEVVA